MLRHMVLLRFEKEVTAQEKQAFYDRLSALSAHLEGMIDFQHRPNISVETREMQGFLDMFWIDFSDAAARDAYLIDPTHRAIGADMVARLENGIEGVLVCDIAMP